jgi:hypothetical protein
LHDSTSTVGQWLERDLAGKPGPTFPDHAQNLEFEGRLAPKKEARPKGPGITLLVAAQYIQKSPKNNGLLRRFDRLPNDLFARNVRISVGFPGYCRPQAG